ncbi:MAG: hydrogen peroxide-inducible genes activator [Gammaproteobacteria bacterium]|nr:hydrogen peroxide-inducible genes activator [Gammaproteobacteria bacterium]
MISIKQLIYALAVERTLHFKKAAELCNISPSALSTSLAEFEKQLGFAVFERDNKKVLITALGKQVLEKAKAIKLLTDDLERLKEIQKAPLSGPMSIGIIPTISPFLLPIILPILRDNYPALNLDVSEEQSHVLVEQVRTGELDAAILALPYQTKGLLSFTFWHENFYWVTHKQDKLASLSSIHTDDVDVDKLMLLKEGHCLKDHALAACKLSHIAPHSLSATSLATLVQLVAGKMGSTLVPDMALSSLVEHNHELISIPLADQGPHRTIAFIVRPNYPRVNNIEILMDLFNQEMTKKHS